MCIPCVKSLLSYLTLCNPMDYSPPGSSVHGILQARILEWVAMPSSWGSSHPGIESTCLTSPASVGRWALYHRCHLGSPDGTVLGETARYSSKVVNKGSLGKESVQFSCSVVSDSLQLHRMQHARPPCPSPSPRVYPNSCPLSR